MAQLLEAAAEVKGEQEMKNVQIELFKSQDILKHLQDKLEEAGNRVIEQTHDRETASDILAMAWIVEHLVERLHRITDSDCVTDVNFPA